MAWTHRLVNKDLEKMTATCSRCGEVRIRKAGKGWRCETARKKGWIKPYQKQEAPPNRCQICNDDKFKIYQDHCHKSGKWRGWICSRCNMVLGLVEDDPKRLQSLIDYLKM